MCQGGGFRESSRNRVSPLRTCANPDTPHPARREAHLSLPILPSHRTLVFCNGSSFKGARRWTPRPRPHVGGEWSEQLLTFTEFCSAPWSGIIPFKPPHNLQDIHVQGTLKQREVNSNSLWGPDVNCAPNHKLHAAHSISASERQVPSVGSGHPQIRPQWLTATEPLTQSCLRRAAYGVTQTVGLKRCPAGGGGVARGTSVQKRHLA